MYVLFSFAFSGHYKTSREGRKEVMDMEIIKLFSDQKLTLLSDQCMNKSSRVTL